MDCTSSCYIVMVLFLSTVLLYLKKRDVNHWEKGDHSKKVITRVLGLAYAPCVSTLSDILKEKEVDEY